MAQLLYQLIMQGASAGPGGSVAHLSPASLSTHTDEDVSAGLPVIEEVG